MLVAASAAPPRARSTHVTKPHPSPACTRTSVHEISAPSLGMEAKMISQLRMTSSLPLTTEDPG